MPSLYANWGKSSKFRSLHRWWKISCRRGVPIRTSLVDFTDFHRLVNAFDVYNIYFTKLFVIQNVWWEWLESRKKTRMFTSQLCFRTAFPHMMNFRRPFCSNSSNLPPFLLRDISSLQLSWLSRELPTALSWLRGRPSLVQACSVGAMNWNKGDKTLLEFWVLFKLRPYFFNILN